MTFTRTIALPNVRYILFVSFPLPPCGCFASFLLSHQSLFRRPGQCKTVFAPVVFHCQHSQLDLRLTFVNNQPSPLPVEPWPAKRGSYQNHVIRSSLSDSAS